ncbi:MAG: hypothetical protein ABIN55_03325, partial [Aeromicrobium sp.]
MPRILPTSLTGRLIVTAVALVAVISLLVAVVATIVMRTYLTDQLDRQLDNALDRGANTIQGQPGTGAGRPPGQRPPPENRGDREGTVTALFGASSGTGQTITESGDLLVLSDKQLAALEDVVPGKEP